MQITSEAANNLQYERDPGFDDQGCINRHLRNPNQNGRWFVYDSLSRLRVGYNENRPHMPVPMGCPSKNYGMANDSLQGGVTACSPTADYANTSADTVLYDAVGNRTDKGGAYTAGNRLANFNSCTYTSDNQNHVTARTCGAVVTSFFWSIEDQLDSIHVTGTPTGVKFLYDANGRVALARVNGAVRSYFLWDGDNLLAELKPTADTLRAEYSYYGGLDNPHSLIVGGTRYYVRTDGLGNVLAITDTASAEKRSYTYDDWGHRTGGTDGLPFNNADRARWKGALSMGPEAEVYFMRSRWYDPGTGRFLSEDPLGIGGGMNPSIFAGNDPINASDPTGMECTTIYDSHLGETGDPNDIQVVGTQSQTCWNDPWGEEGPSYPSFPPGGPGPLPRDPPGPAVPPITPRCLLGLDLGDDAVDYWGNMNNQATEGTFKYYASLWLGLAASLWTTETGGATASTLLGGYGVRVLGPFRVRNLSGFTKRGLGRIRDYLRYDAPSHGAKPAGWDGRLAKAPNNPNSIPPIAVGAC